MKFIKKVFMFLIVVIIFIIQIDVDVLAASEYIDGFHDIILHYILKQDFKKQSRTLWIGYDPYVDGCKKKYYNPYGGTYLTLNGSKYDDFGGQVDINDPASVSCLGVNRWDHIIITIELGEEFFANKCLDALFSLLKESGDITVPIWQHQFNLLKDKEVNFGKKQKLVTVEKNLF